MDRSLELRKVRNDDEMILLTDYDDDEEDGGGNRSNVLYTTCPEINIHVDSDRKRKITIVEEEPQRAPKTRRSSSNASTRLRRAAIMNLAKTRSRTRSRSRDCRRSRSRSRAPQEQENCEVFPIEKYEKGPIRLPTDLCKKSVVGIRAKGEPACIQLPSPLYVLTEQQVTGVSEAKMVVFTTKILLTTRKLTMKERQHLYAEMVEAQVVGESRSSTDIHEKESNESFESKIYYSSKGVYIHTVQNVKKISTNRSSTNMQEKTYSNICKTRIIGEKGKFMDGFLNIQCIETIECKNQIYTRTELFKIGLQTEKADGVYEVTSEKKTFDPSMTIKFDERILFDRKNIGVTVNHKASADMSRHWDHDAGSFGEEQCEYREISFVFGAPSGAIEKRPSLSGVANRGEHTPTKTPHRTTKQETLSQMKEASFLRTTPQATSTPKTENSPIAPLRSTTAKPTLTPVGSVKTPKSPANPPRRFSPNEIDLDRSLTNRPAKSPAKSPATKSSPIRPKGHLRVKETRVTREIREETGRPPQVSEKKEERIKEREVSLDSPRDQSKSYNMSIVAGPPEKAAANPPNVNHTILVEGPSPIKVAPVADKMQTFSKMLCLEMMVNNKPCQVNLKMDLLARTSPEVDIRSIKFDEKMLWEKSSDWSVRSARDSTSNTKTIAVQQSDIMRKGDEKSEKK